MASKIVLSIVPLTDKYGPFTLWTPSTGFATQLASGAQVTYGPSSSYGGENATTQDEGKPAWLSWSSAVSSLTIEFDYEAGRTSGNHLFRFFCYSDGVMWDKYYDPLGPYVTIYGDTTTSGHYKATTALKSNGDPINMYCIWVSGSGIGIRKGVGAFQGTHAYGCYVNVTNYKATIEVSPFAYNIISTLAATDITATSATLNGSILQVPEGNFTERGFEYYKEGLPDDVTYIKEDGDFGVDAYNLPVSNLESNVKYYFRAVAKGNSLVEEVYDSTWLNFTPGAGPVVTTQAATQISYQCAMGNGTIVSGGTVTERGFEVKLLYSGTLGDYVFHRTAGFAGDVTYIDGNWEGTLTKTETEEGDFAAEAYELVLGYPSVLGNPSYISTDKLFKCESYTCRAYMVSDEVTYYGDYVGFDTLCDSGGDQQPTDDISEGDPTVPIIPIDPIPEPEFPPFEWEPEEPELYPPWDWDLPDWAIPDYPPMSFVGDFYYRKPYTKKDLDELRKKCITYNKNSIEFALVLRHNMNVLKEFFNMMTDYMSKDEFNDFTDLIPPQRLKELSLDPLNPTDFRDIINGFIRNTVDNNIAVNRNFSLIQAGLSDYETESDDAYFREINSNMKSVTEDNPDVHRLKKKIDSLNREVAFNFRSIMRNLKIVRARLL